MKDLSSILHSLGLIESEIKTYTAALRHGPGTVVELTKLSNLSRQATYSAIESLTGRGLMSSALHGKKRYYFAENPDKLLSYARRREIQIKEEIQDLERDLPELKLKIGGERPTVRLFEGKEGVRTIITDIGHSKVKTVDEISDSDALRAIIDEGELRLMLKGLQYGTTQFRVLLGGQPFGGKLGADVVQLPKELWGFKADIVIYGDKIALMTYEGKMYSIIVESKALAQTVKILFDLALKGSSKTIT